MTDYRRGQAQHNTSDLRQLFPLGLPEDSRLLREAGRTKMASGEGKCLRGLSFLPVWAARGLETGRQNPGSRWREKAKGQGSVESVPDSQSSVFPPLASVPPTAAPLPARSVPGAGVESEICFGFLKDIWEQNDMFLSLSVWIFFF